MTTPRLIGAAARGCRAEKKTFGWASDAGRCPDTTPMAH
jgi:hypothetical protein